MKELDPLRRRIENDSRKRARDQFARLHGGVGAPPAHDSRERSLSAATAVLPSMWELLPRGKVVAEVPGMRALLRRDAVFRRSLATSDVIAAYLAIVATLVLLPGANFRFTPALVIIAPAIVCTAKALGLYDGDQHRLRKTTLDDTSALFHLSVLFALGVWIAQGPMLLEDLTKSQVLALVGFGFVLTLVGRASARAAVRCSTPAERCLLLGDSDDLIRVEQKITSAAGVNATVVGRYSLAEIPHGTAPGEHRGDGIARLIWRHSAQRVVIATDGQEQDEIMDFVRLVKALGDPSQCAPPAVGGGRLLLGVRRPGRDDAARSSPVWPDPVVERLKRITDVGGALVALLVLAPLMSLISIAIVLDSRGSPLFLQPRIGRRGERFRIVKFRSMVHDAEAIKETCAGSTRFRAACSRSTVTRE